MRCSAGRAGASAGTVCSYAAVTRWPSRAPVAGHRALPAGGPPRLPPGRRPQLGQDVGHVHAGRLRADEQGLRDLGVRAAVGQQQQNLAFRSVRPNRASSSTGAPDADRRTRPLGRGRPGQTFTGRTLSAPVPRALAARTPWPGRPGPARRGRCQVHRARRAVLPPPPRGGLPRAAGPRSRRPAPRSGWRPALASRGLRFGPPYPGVSQGYGAAPLPHAVHQADQSCGSS